MGRAREEGVQQHSNPDPSSTLSVCLQTGETELSLAFAVIRHHFPAIKPANAPRHQPKCASAVVRYIYLKRGGVLGGYWWGDTDGETLVG